MDYRACCRVAPSFVVNLLAREEQFRIRLLKLRNPANCKKELGCGLPMFRLCRLTGHVKSRERIQHDPVFAWRSVCRYCGEPMVRYAHKDWRLEKDIPAEELELREQL